MRIEFSKEQVEQLYAIIGKTQITGNDAKAIVMLQQVIEKAVQAEQGTPKAEKVEPKK